MRLPLLMLWLLLPAVQVAAQTSPTSAPNPNTAAAASGGVITASMTSILPDLDRLQAAASQAALDIGHMRIEKWKVDGVSSSVSAGSASRTT